MNTWLRRMFTALMGLIMMLSLFGPLTASAANARPDKGNLIIHKLQYNGPAAPVIKNNGLELGSIPDSTKPLKDAEFSLYKVADNTELPVEVSGEADEVLTTDEEGLAHFKDLPAGRYYVVETDQPKGVESYSAPFLVDVPMMHPDGKSWNNTVHVYPKNQLVLGAVKLEKLDEDGKTKLDDAVFNLYKENGEIVKENLKTKDGHIFVGELEVGKYYFQETAAPEGYGLDTTKIPFKITLEDHAYNDGELIKKAVIKADMVNYDVPDIEKYVTEEGKDSDTMDFFEEITWIIKPEVPGNIDKYKKFDVVDTFGKEHTYKGNIVVTGKKDGKTVYPSFTATGLAEGTQGGELTFSLVPADLVGVSDLTITFKTHLNEKAILGQDYENNVELEMHNGHASYTEEDEDPPYVHTGGKPFIKTNVAGDKLEGAEFVIYRKNGKQKEYLTTNHTWSTKADAKTFVSDENGLFEVKGLAYGDYYLEETKAPRVNDVQYHLLDEDVKFTVNANSYYSAPSEITSPDADPTADPANILNEAPGIDLPQTGGMGSLVFSVLGLGLMGTSVKVYQKSSKKEEK